MTFRPIPSPQAIPGTTSTRDGSDWRDRAACLDEDPELFFPLGNSSPDAVWQIAAAKAVCARCEVMDTCLPWALETDLDYGVAGGLSEDERRALKRRQRRNNPPAPSDPKPAAQTKDDPITRPTCGSEPGYNMHSTMQERQCGPCREWRAARRARPACGTGAGYRAHASRKERACDPCKAAKAEESAEYRRRNRTNAA